MKLSFLRPAAMLAFLLSCSGAFSPEQDSRITGEGGVRTMTVELLPDLNVPRSAHVLAYVGGELTVIGGHTTGFVPTATAEYFRDGAWHLVETIYPHDFGFGLVLPSEEVLVGGGSAEPFGVGQTWSVESYDPAAHRFSPLPILDRKAGAHTNAARLSDGRIVVAGSWYAEDAVSVYSPETGGAFLLKPAFGRSGPLILQSAPDNALILSSLDSRDEACAAVADRLQGGPVEVPLLREWTDWGCQEMQQMSQFFIGVENVGGYAWLFPARRKEDGQLGLIKLVGESFSILETESDLLMESPEGEALTSPNLLVDKTKECAWLVQCACGAGRIYVTRVDYGVALGGGRAPVSRYVAELPEGCPSPWSSPCVMLPGGRIAVIGGLASADNYHPGAAAFILHTEPMPEKGGLRWWLALTGVLLGGGAVSLLGRRLSKRAGDGILRQAQDDKEGAQDVRPCHSEQREESVGTHTLMSRIIALMEKEELWRQKGLKVSDLATRLGTNATYISACINGQMGKSFPELLNDYRLRCARQLMLEHPDRHLSDIAEECGFSNERSFFRSFKARTGLTPQEWKASKAA